MKKLFKNFDISWKRLIIFSIIIGIYTGLVMCIPFLKDTSFQDIGISYECWVLFAVIIVINQDKWYTACLKCFVFFLISQPLVYITEIVLGKLALEMGIYYYLRIWLPITFLTIPGGAIAYLAKKENILGSIVLGLGNSILSLMGIFYFLNTIENFPYHLLTCIFCFVTIVIMTLNIYDKKKYQVIAFVVPILVCLIVIIFAKINGLTII